MLGVRLTDNGRMTVSTATARRWMIAAAVVALLLGAARAQAATPLPTRSVSVGQPPRLPPGSAPRGALAPTTRLHLEVLLSPRDPAAMAALVNQISTPGSPSFRHYLGPGEFAARFGATPATVAAVDAALRDSGLVPGPVSADRLSIPVMASAVTAQRAFAVSLQRFRGSDGRTVYANTSAPRVHASVAGSVSGVLGLNDVAVRRPALATSGPPRPSRSHAILPHASSSSPGPQPCTAARNQASGTGPYTIDQLASAYAFTGLYSAGDLGAGITVGVYELEPNLPSDIAAYQSCFSTAAQVSYTKVDGGAGSGAGGGEAALDIENVIGLAPASRVIVYQGPNNDPNHPSGPLDTYRQMINDNQAKVISTSWGFCEPKPPSPSQADPELQAENMLFAQAAAQGQTIVAASGDSGSEDCADPNTRLPDQLAVDDPASQPYVTGVGGTKLSDAGAPSTQSVWNNATGAGGGGLSSTWLKPAYQPTAAGFSNGQRQVPDVSADADPNTGYVVYHTDARGGSWTTFGGTSAAAPLWAALTALADASPGCAGRPLGALNPALYRVAAGTGSTAAFTDVLAGNNDFTNTHPGRFVATSGYDLSSGLGTPIATNTGGTGLVDQLCGGPAPMPKPSPGPPPSPGPTPASATLPSAMPAAAAMPPSSPPSAPLSAFGPASTSPAQAANASIRGLHIALRQRGRTLVLGSAACPSACRVAIDVRALSAVAHGNARGRVSASVHVGALVVSVATHRHRRLMLHMSAAALRLLRNHRRVQIALALRVRDERGRLHTQTRTLSLRFSGH